jgi:hypothetical protein
MAARGGDAVALDGQPLSPGITKECTSCHADKTVSKPEHSDCKSCHMAFTGKSASARGSFFGDIRSHVFTINTDAGAASWLDADKNPTSDPASGVYASPFITMDFACLRCHADKDLAWAASNAAGVHQ